MPYTKKQVERGRKLAATGDQSKWGLGDLAQEVAPDVGSLSMEWMTSPLRKELEDFADAIGVDYTRLLEYRKVAMAYTPAQRRDDVSFAVHQELMSADNHVKLLKQRKSWTVRTAREYLGKASKDGNVTPPPLSKEQKKAIVAEAIKDPEIVDDIVADPRTHVDLINAQDRNRAKVAKCQEVDRQKRRDAKEDDLDVQSDLIDAERAIMDAKRSLKLAVKFLQKAGRVPDDHRDLIGDDLDDLNNLIAWVRTVSMGGNRTMDEQLQALLAGGE